MDETTSSPYQQNHNTTIMDLGNLQDTPSHNFCYALGHGKSFSQTNARFGGEENIYSVATTLLRSHVRFVQPAIGQTDVEVDDQCLAPPWKGF
jgi:hypothetical protein